MKKVLLSLFVLILLSACGNDPIKDDLLNYINNEVAPLGDEEDKLLTAYSNVTGDNYESDEDLYYALDEDIIPRYYKFITKLENIRPKTAEVKELHEIYVAAANNQYNAMTQVLAALEGQDYNLIAEANDKLSKGRKGVRDWQDRLSQLMKEHNIELKE
ncbi:MAG: hypothetical protein P0Y55_16990 [Candidatus Cohnella colombiensis]|uniref:Lipoprotein n=1 Tax=Candidatus Cohnella colombiensis TaxID=3121368 RepID=A0AA95JBM0_9BACL|nr:MAG: hypothetical protein P0Y55_16990 [Cohnella sp.]